MEVRVEGLPIDCRTYQQGYANCLYLASVILTVDCNMTV